MPERGSYARGIARRQEILRVALDVFAREGYRGTSLREVARRCEMSLPGLMHYFESKEHLLTAILQKRDEIDSEPLDSATDIIDGLIAVMRHNRDVPGLVQLHLTLAAAAEDPAHPAHAHFMARLASIRSDLADAIRARIERGMARADLDPELVARLLIAAADGIQIQWALDRSIDMGDDIESLWRLLAY
ncbi:MULTISPECIES: TetR/AcrR family transcriptional regulator [unclassified Rathayibacter]|uniref:TetR/AcrR family transcriptional regulator n=1 Tax=unclassified Rathayibacter TaxID=2609250 RepID=UPI00188C9632|nr:MULTISPECIES: TetR/AcrR family transcriptional regulator [unclassified Rathayibacter]MBF4461344.1 TetR/AcrR family transcriptional regulator [Rathayibacter sp. VKM Ac-2879]MBF4502755.1 TetR/AcrR family transcriptional regulator [Rathayibacter sp. VKM Ac-2878]